LQFDRGSRLAFLVLVGALTEATLRDHTHALGQRPGHLLGELAPDRCAEEQGIAVLPFVRLTVERAWSACDGEVRHRKPVLRVPQLRVRGQVPDHVDYSFASHYLFSSLLS